MASIDDEDELRATRILYGVEWEEDIQEGEYVRLKNGKIIKFKKFSIARRYSRYRGEDLINIKTIIDNRGCHYKYDNITKHSPNLIDLIEVEDLAKVIDNGSGNEEIVYIFDESMIQAIKQDIENEEIELIGICTHEQFNSVMYKVKE